MGACRGTRFRWEGRRASWAVRLVLMVAVPAFVATACSAEGGVEDPPAERVPGTPEAALWDSGVGEGPRAPEFGVSQRYTGLFSMLGAPEFRSCEGWALPVNGPAGLELMDLHVGLTPGSEPGEDIFVDLVAELRQGAGGPVLDVLEVRRAAYEGWGCGGDDVGVLLEASGTEPFWSLTARREGAEWRTPEERMDLSHGGLFLLGRGGWGLEGRDASGAPWSADFQSGGCRNAMSGAYSHLAAEVRIRGEVFSGCAFLGPATGAEG